jgi:alpha-amylase/alpha-mannosidase (GH57 family)
VSPAPLALLWHLHQPLYRLQGEASCFLPWVRLHAIRSYYDMARVLESFPGVRVTVNLTPVLVEQLRAYAGGARDLFLDLASTPAEDLSEAQRSFLLDHFFSAPERPMISALPRLAELKQRRDRARRLRGPAEAWREFSVSDLRDLQLLFDLCWFGFMAREEFPVLRALRERGMSYTRDDLAQMHAVEREILGRILPLYRSAAERGQVEISTSPYAHPILPLLIDTDSAREATPEAPLPPRFARPEDARAQVEEGLESIGRELGALPRGVWPSEGSVSQETAGLLARCGVSWAASDARVLQASETAGPADPGIPWEIADEAAGLALVFRDPDLSDRIGFDYARQDPDRAVEDFLAAARERVQGGGRMLLVALDGENPWEHYPRAGARFLRALYGALSRDKTLAAVTVGEAISACPERGRLKRLRAGSWIRADLGTWIGGPEKNRAWGLLGRIRASLDAALADPAQPAEARRRAWEALRAAEGSDWFWWLDGQFESAYRAHFDQAFRGHLRQACEALGRPVPEALGWPIPSPEHRPESVLLAEPTRTISPAIDGYEGDYFEWQGAVRLLWTDLQAGASMQRSEAGIESLRYGFSEAGDFFLRLDPHPRHGPALFRGLGLDLLFRLGERALRVRVELDEHGDLKEARRCAASDPGLEPCVEMLPSAARAAARKVLELSLPAGEIELPPGSTTGLQIHLRVSSGDLALREIGLRLPRRAAARIAP